MTTTPISEPSSPAAGSSTSSSSNGADWPDPAYWARSALTVVGVLALCWLVIELDRVLVLILVALVLAVGMQRPVDWLERHGFRRGVAVATLTLASIALLGGFLALVLPSVIRETSALIDQAPDYLHKLRGQSWVRNVDKRFNITEKLQHAGADLPDRAWSFGASLLSFAVSLITIVALTLCFATDLPRVRKAAARLLMPAHRERFESIVDRVIQRVGGYVNGNLLVSVVAGVAAFIALWLIGVPYAASLAAWVAITDLIPAIGALVGAGVAMTVAAFTGSTELIATGMFFLVYQQIENYVIAPKIMKGAIDMSVEAVLVAILVGAELYGFVGVLLALPLAATIHTVLDELYLDERRRTVRRHERREERMQRWSARLRRGPADRAPASVTRPPR